MDQARLNLEIMHSLLMEWRGAVEEDAVLALDQCLAQIYFARDGRYDPLQCVRQLSQLLQSLEVSEPQAETKSYLISLASDSERLLALLGFSPESALPPLRTFAQRLGLRSVQRKVIVPVTLRDQASDDPLVIEGVPPQDARGFSGGSVFSFTPAGWARTRLEVYFQELCGLLRSRTPQMGESWKSISFIEARALALLDAIHGLGADLEYLEVIAEHCPAPDPGLVEGLAIALGSLTGRDGLAASERYFAKWESEEDFPAALLASWSVLENPVVDEVAHAWLSHPRPERRALAFRLLARRQRVATEYLERALGDDPLVAAAALVPFVLRGTESVRYRLDEVSARLTALPSMGTEHQELANAFQLAGVLAGYPHSYQHVLAACRVGQENSGTIAGIGAEQSDAQRLLDWTMENPNVQLVEALGWAGDPSCLPHLIGLLSHQDQPIVFAAAQSLERITGAGLVDELELPAEAVMENDPFSEPDAEPLKRRETDPRDPFDEPSPDTMLLPSIEPERWRAYIVQNQAALIPGVRTRRGYQYTHMVSIHELREVVGAPRERVALCHELVLRTGRYFYFDVHSFVAVQEAELERISGLFAEIAPSPGLFALPMQRRPLGAR